ncbi:MAG: TIGR01212 family radical SAM protein [Ammonifex sp.]|jgi:radical SAM protein (TIGR01212 family)|nr:MAG: TIGR01212 family radical SAM protein [Ammonifex sp.]
MEKRYYTFGRFLKEHFGEQVRKIPLDAGFGCPNRDGTTGTGGCVFCLNRAFSPFVEQSLSISEQIRRFKASNRRGGRYLAYFQAYTNTYAPVERLARLYGEVLADPEVVGLCVATRPDCVPEGVLDLLESYTERFMVWVEYGLQSSHGKTLKLIKRGHDVGSFANAVERTKGRGIYIGAHVILGLPGESREEMLQTARFLNTVRVDGVKLHHLQIFTGTPLEADYARGEVSALGLGEYVSLACDFIESLAPEIIIMRLAAEADDALLVAPRWDASKTEVVNAVDRELQRRDTRQGSGILVPG